MSPEQFRKVVLRTIIHHSMFKDENGNCFRMPVIKLYNNHMCFDVINNKRLCGTLNNLDNFHLLEDCPQKTFKDFQVPNNSWEGVIPPWSRK